mgnify:CR=1 FL=1
MKRGLKAAERVCRNISDMYRDISLNEKRIERKEDPQLRETIKIIGLNEKRIESLPCTQKACPFYT